MRTQVQEEGEDDDGDDDDNNDDDDDDGDVDFDNCNDNANLRGHKNKKKDAASIESEDDSTRGKFPACFQLFPPEPENVAKKPNLKIFPQNGLKVDPAFSAITM